MRPIVMKIQLNPLVILSNGSFSSVVFLDMSDVVVELCIVDIDEVIDVG